MSDVPSYEHHDPEAQEQAGSQAEEPTEEPESTSSPEQAPSEAAPDAPSAPQDAALEDAPGDAAPDAALEDAPGDDAAEEAPAGDAPQSAEDAPAKELTAETAEVEGTAPETTGETSETAGTGESSETGEADEAKKKRKKRKKKEQSGPTVAEVVARIGTSNEAVLAYVESPEPRWQRLPRAVREELIADLPAPTAAALLGPAALARHFVASAAGGRYRDLFALWTLFSRHPEDCKPELAARGQALERARRNLRLATKIGLSGHAGHVAADIQRAEGLIWQWLRQVLDEHLHIVGARPIVAAALSGADPDAEIPLPAEPSAAWLAEAAAARQEGPLPSVIEERLGANVHRLPATISTLRLAATHYPDRIPHLLDAVDLDAPDAEAFLAWARDHGYTDRLVGRLRERLEVVAGRDREEALRLWHRWRERGVDLELPQPLLAEGLGELDLARPETAHLAKALLDRGEDVAVQQRIEELAARNRQLAEKAFEAATSAGIWVTLPAVLEANPIVRDGTRCPRCHAWTWVRPGHEQRCPWPESEPTSGPGDDFELAAAEATERQ